MTRTNFIKRILYAIEVVTITYVTVVIVGGIVNSWKFWLSIVILMLVLLMLGILRRFIQRKYERFKNRLSSKARVVLNTAMKTFEVSLLFLCGAAIYDFFQTNPTHALINILIFTPVLIYDIYSRQLKLMDNAVE